MEGCERFRMAHSMAGRIRIYWTRHDNSWILPPDYDLPRCEKNSYDNSTIIALFYHIWSYMEDYIHCCQSVHVSTHMVHGFERRVFDIPRSLYNLADLPDRLIPVSQI